MLCPVCDSGHIYAHFDMADMRRINTVSIPMYCKNCGSDWTAIYLHQYDEEIYDNLANRWASKRKARRN